jgi:outer membrane protein, heavy metal efflux system
MGWRDRRWRNGRCMACAGLLTLFMAGRVAAQPAPAGDSLTLEAAMARALAANPTLAAARLRGAANLAGVAVARERLNPEASVELEKETPKQAYGVAVPLELGGKRSKRIAVSEAVVRAGEAEVAATIAQVHNDVRRAYFDALVADARLAILHELQDLSRRVRDTAQTRFEAGDSPRLEVLHAEVALATAENDATAAEGIVAAARAKLNALLEFPLETKHRLSTSIDAANAVVTAAMLDLAHSGSSELAVLDRRIEEQRARVELAKALRVPDVTPAATLTYDAEPEFTYGWRFGVAVALPILTTHKAAVTVEESTLAQIMAERQATQHRIDGDVTAAAATAEAQRQAYVRYRDVILPQAQQVEQMAQVSYELGQTGIAALLQALQASRDVRMRSLEAASQFQSALADLERATGAILP